LEIPAVYCENILGIRVIREYSENTEIEDKSIDVIVSCHVIEYVSDPTLFVRRAYSLLKRVENWFLKRLAYV
jgi:2-polyprenyl-3-methyl-5-hydroxy-6-metoxy-1,4-benzoquinol methylase